MGRQPNYKGQRIERDRAKELKRLARNEAKAAKSNARRQPDDENSEERSDGQVIKSPESSE